MNDIPIPPSVICDPNEVYAGSTVIVCPRTGAVVYMRSPENDSMFANYISVNRKRFSNVRMNKELCYSVKLACDNMRTCHCVDHDCKASQKLVSELIMTAGVTVPMTIIPNNYAINAMIMRTLLLWPSIDREKRCEFLYSGSKKIFPDTSKEEMEREKKESNISESDINMLEEGMVAICKSQVGSIVRMILALRGLTAIKLGKVDDYIKAEFFNGLEIDIAHTLINKEKGISEAFKVFKDCWVSNPHFAFSVVLHVISAVHSGFVSAKYQCCKGVSAYDTSINLIVGNSYPAFALLSGAIRSQKGTHVSCNHRGVLDFLFNVTQTFDNKSGVDLYSEDDLSSNFVTFCADHPALLIIRSPVQGQGNTLDEAALRVEKMIQSLMNTTLDKANIKTLVSMFMETYGERHRYISSMSYHDLVIWMAWEYIYQVNVNMNCHHNIACSFMTTGICSFVHENVEEKIALAFMSRLEAAINNIRAEKHAAFVQMIESSSSNGNGRGGKPKSRPLPTPPSSKPKFPQSFPMQTQTQMPQYSRTVNVSQMNRIMRNSPSVTAPATAPVGATAPAGATVAKPVPVQTPISEPKIDPVPVIESVPEPKAEPKKMNPIGTRPKSSSPSLHSDVFPDFQSLSEYSAYLDHEQKKLDRLINSLILEMNRPLWITNPFDLRVPSFMDGVILGNLI